MIGCYEKYVGFDGKSYYCKLCGKAGFKSVKAVIGHLNSCPAKSTTSGAFSSNDEQIEHHQSTTTSRRIVIKFYNALRKRVERLERQVSNELLHLRAEQLVNKYSNKRYLVVALILGIFVGIGIGYWLARSSTIMEGFGKIGQKALNSFVNKSINYLWKQIA